MKIDISKYKDVEPQANKKGGFSGDRILNPKFCVDCGSRYILKEGWIRGFNPLSGEPNIMLRWECSSKEKWSWWKRFWHQDIPSSSSPWVYHESFSTNEKGE